MTQVLQTIKSEDLPLSSVFQAFYEVPAYQREYVWRQEQVEELLHDVNTEFVSADGGPTEYFIGSIIALGKDNQTFELIDGQQRMTTLFLVLCAIRDRLKELGANVPETLSQQIAAASVDDEGDEVRRYRVELQYEDSQGVLERIGAALPVDERQTRTRSVENILRAYATARTFLQSECPDASKTRKLHGFLINRVKLIRVQTASVAHALKVFETINDRGVGLDSMDLLKNLLFMHAESAAFEELKTVWKGMVDTLHEAKEKPLRFLRYLIFADFESRQRLREEDIYGWLRDHESQTGYRSDPLGFARRLARAADAYVRFAGGRNVDGTVNPHLENLRTLSGAAHQQFILLLAGRHLPQSVFDRLAAELENLFFAYVITREPTNTFEQTFTQWCASLRQVRTLPELEGFLASHFAPAKEKLAVRYDVAFKELTEESVQRYRLRYILAKLSQYVDLIAKGEHGAAGRLGTYINKTVQIEHILPQTPTPAIRAAFEPTEEYGIFVRLLGNLTLLEKAINASVGNGVFADKQAAFKQSDFLLTRSLAGPVQVGQNTSYEQAAKHLEVFQTWQGEQILQRQDMLRELAFLVWDMPQPKRALRG
jgi:Protein of unknown function DUF262/Protein of unknown function (DUF1524)